MRRVFPVFMALLFLTGLATTLAWSQDEIMTLKSDDLAPHTRPPVKFTHEKHSENTACAYCHHEFDDNFNKQGSEGGTCSDCHTAQSTPENQITLVMAFHKQCKQCHSFLLEKKAPSGPVMCGGCHLRKPPAESSAK